MAPVVEDIANNLYITFNYHALVLLVLNNKEGTANCDDNKIESY